MIYLLTAIGLSPGGSKICDCILPQAEDVYARPKRVEDI